MGLSLELSELLLRSAVDAERSCVSFLTELAADAEWRLQQKTGQDQR